MVRSTGTSLRRAPPPTDEELAQARIALATIRRVHAELLAARGGKLFPDSAGELAALRAERDAELP